MLESFRQEELRVYSNGKFMGVDKLFILLAVLAEGASDPMLLFIGPYVTLTHSRFTAS